MAEIIKVSSYKNGQIIFHFSNKVQLSIIWDYGSYSDNSNMRPKDINRPSDEVWSSKTVEVYSMGSNPNGINEWLDFMYGGNPAGYVPVQDIPAIIERACE